MQKYRLKIELLSDTCCGSGEGNGVDFDILSSYDDRGFPVILGKRIKGLLRDKAEFLVEYQYETVDRNLIDLLFGTGVEAGKLRIGNAELEEAETMKKELSSLMGEEGFLTPKRVENVFTTKRFSTAIEKNGVAKDSSLRLFGTVPKGEVFVAEVSLDAEKGGREEVLLENTVKLLRGIGLSRNRGLGEVKCSLLPATEKKKEFHPEEGSERIDYIFKLTSSVISPSDSIAGSAIQGFFLNRLREEEVQEFLWDVKFSNAYLSDGERRFLPMPLGMISPKSDDKSFLSVADGGVPEENKIYVKQGGFYQLEKKKLKKMTAKTATEFHFAKKTKDIFSISSLKEGQFFAGSIYGKAHQLARLTEILSQSGGELSLGASATAQYGGASMISFIGKRASEINEEELSGAEFLLEFLSDAILVDEMGVNRADEEILKKEVRNLLGKDVSFQTIQARAVSIGGYQAKWGLPKRRFTALAKGSQIAFTVEEGLSGIKETGFLGLLQNEGYGEYRIRKKFENVKLKKQDVFFLEEEVPLEKARYIVEEVALEYLKDEMMFHAKNSVDEYKLDGKLSSSSAMRILPAFHHSENRFINKKASFFESFKLYIEENFRGENNEAIRKFTDYAITSFTGFPLDTFPDENIQKAFHEKKDILFKNYLENFIFHTKMYYRKKGE